jgi:hypothetical protein
MPPFKLPATGLAAALLATAALSACGHLDSLDAETLQRDTRTLASLAAEAAFLIEELRADHLKSSFTVGHLRDLRDDATTAQHEIARTAPAALQQRQAAVKRLAEELTQALRDIAIAPGGSPSRLDGDHRRLLDLKRQLDALGATQ